MNFRPGDEIEIKVTVESVHPTGGYHVREPDGSIMWLSDATLAAGRLLPRPIGVGDRVRHKTDLAWYEVVGIHGDRAHLFYEPQDFHQIAHLSDLTLDKG